MKYLLILWFTSIAIVVEAQNLVPDSSFEIKNNCPTGYSEIGLRYLTKYWFTPTKGTSDFFHQCSSSKSAGVPNNFFGTKKAKTGYGYSGLFLLSETKPFYREYIETKLNSTLKKDSFYCVKVHLSRPTYITTTADKFGIYFSKSRIKNRTESVLKKNPQVVYNSELLLSVDYEWKCFNQIYKANGDENFITIGNFYNDKSIRTRKFEMPAKYKNRYIQFKGEVYYYIDDVSVLLIGSKSECRCNDNEIGDSFNIYKVLESKPRFVDSSFKLIDSLLLGNVNFKSSSLELQNSNLESLNDLIIKLKNDTNLLVEISGHTDSIGIDSLNIELSINRAKFVSDYLIKNGVLKEQITYNGYGSAFPIASNLTIEGRLKNRRVEIKVYLKSVN
jgi:OmpA-OmpF porin, OOP family